MRLQHPLETVTSTVDGDVLAVLANVAVPFTVTQLAERIPHRSPQGVRVALRRLVEQGIVTSIKLGRTHGFELSRDHLAAAPIMALADLRHVFLERLRRLVEGLSGIRYAALFGSAARDEMRIDSDIDLFFVCAADADRQLLDEQIGRVAAEVSRMTGNDTRPLVVDEEAIPLGQPMLESIAAEGIPLGGRRDWLHHEISRRRREQTRQA